ncbi:hypothetical protein IW261DRAFT_1426994 [Armillaria novae-zelandiae]|uniref:Uncharacterized protein n=1 Tax=Armillaria novae-zelandiae TaxID=153914 RepID=A0AA39NHX6_9AGAR|nr:hypothetical protein IW261DRAFT_1426994 [Armillaria novae-zelandiae]
MAERLEAETDSIKGEILATLEELQEELSEAEGKQSPADYLEAIDQAPALLQCFLQEVAEQTGWWFSVIAGGPLPTDNGNIHMWSFHIGKTVQGQNFLDEYAGFSVDPNDPNASEVCSKQGPPKDLQLPPLPPLPPMYDNSDMQEDFPPLPLLPPVHDNSDMQQGAKQAPERAEEGDNNEANPEVRASKHACKPHACCEVVATGWLTLAVGYLLDSMLGLEWQNLLVCWQDLEGLLQAQGCSPGKGCMGTLSSRPSALSHWLLNCCYNIYPHPPANFSNELCKWWNTMQPGWHQNKMGTLPLPVYDHSLDSMLQKGGPNGIVTVLVGLMWWGQGTLEADDRVLWTAMVMDIHMCIQAMQQIQAPRGQGRWSKSGEEDTRSKLIIDLPQEFLGRGQECVGGGSVRKGWTTLATMSKVLAIGSVM